MANLENQNSNNIESKFVQKIRNKAIKMIVYKGILDSL